MIPALTTTLAVPSTPGRTPLAPGLELRRRGMRCPAALRGLDRPSGCGAAWSPWLFAASTRHHEISGGRGAFPGTPAFRVVLTFEPTRSRSSPRLAPSGASRSAKPRSSTSRRRVLCVHRSRPRSAGSSGRVGARVAVEKRTSRPSCGENSVRAPGSATSPLSSWWDFRLATEGFPAPRRLGDASCLRALSIDAGTWRARKRSSAARVEASWSARGRAGSPSTPRHFPPTARRRSHRRPSTPAGWCFAASAAFCDLGGHPPDFEARSARSRDPSTSTRTSTALAGV